MAVTDEQLRVWGRLQEEMAAKAATDDAWALGATTLVAGLDISPVPCAHDADDGPGERAVASLVVLALPGLQPVYSDDLAVTLPVPYIPGFLGFREVPAYASLLQRAVSAGVRPDLVLVDGFGALHPRRCGCAAHLGVLTGLRTVGVAKNLLHVDGLQERRVRSDMQRQRQAEADAAGVAAAEGSRGSSGGGSSVMQLIGANEGVLGAAVCSAGTARPVYVSVGHRVSLSEAVAAVLRCCAHRVPEPIRLADQRSRAAAQRRAQDFDGGSPALQPVKVVLQASIV